MRMCPCPDAIGNFRVCLNERRSYLPQLLSPGHCGTLMIIVITDIGISKLDTVPRPNDPEPSFSTRVEAT